MKVKMMSLGMLLVAYNTGAQCLSGLGGNVLDAPTIKEHIPTKKLVSYAPLREADVMWSKRVWRTVDLRQKMNFPLYYPLEPTTDRMSLWDLMKCNIVNEGSITPYEISGASGYDWDGEFLFPILPPNGNIRDSIYRERINRLLFREVITIVLDEDGEPMYDELGNEITKVDYEPIESKEIVKYYVKEDWFFDKQRSVMDVRIIGICPVINEYDDEGEFKAERMMFWTYFPECRYVFQNSFVYNRKNDSQRMSFDDLFWKRMFASHIHKESNVYNRELGDYERDGVRALLEAEKIKNKMEQFEHDLWHL